MSAIAGILFFEGAPVEPGLIETLTSAMERRGPDEQTHWVQGSVALGHCMLRTTSESVEEHQPLMSQDKNLVLVWDGRIDNREEVRRHLIGAGAILRDNSDAELVLQSYALWREESPKRLLGDFAFAVWDASRNRFFCARDHMGARPFYYTRNAHFFAFASEEAALPQLPGVSSRPNEELIAYYLVPSFLEFKENQSWLEDVWALPAAANMSVLPDGDVRIDKYWWLEPGEESRFASDEVCQEAFLEVFNEAVRCRMRSASHVAVMTSGGLDSASIVAMAKRFLPERPGKELHTYSAISDQPESCVESRCIQAITRGLGEKAHYLSVPSLSGMLCEQDLSDIAWSSPHPVDNSILLPAIMCLAASRDGHRVMLHGASGDLTTKAPARYPAYLLRSGQWLQAWRECRDASHNNNYLLGAPPGRLYLRNMWTAYAPEAIKRLSQKIRRQLQDDLSQSLISHAFADKIKLSGRLGESVRNRDCALPSLQADQIRTLLPPHGITSGLSGYEQVGGKFGLELRDPWADRRLVEFWLRLPLKYKVRNGWTKYLVRASLTDELGEGVAWRLGKQHLGWQIVCKLLSLHKGKVAKMDSLHLDCLLSYTDKSAVINAFEAYSANPKDDDAALRVYEMQVLSLWLAGLGQAVK